MPHTAAFEFLPAAARTRVVPAKIEHSIHSIEVQADLARRLEMATAKKEIGVTSSKKVRGRIKN
jgi:hypothetical protein